MGETNLIAFIRPERVTGVDLRAMSLLRQEGRDCSEREAKRSEFMKKSPIGKYAEVDVLRTSMAKARKLGDEQSYWNAFRRTCTIRGIDPEDPLTRGFIEMLKAYEVLLTQKNGRTTVAVRTRQKLFNRGVRRSLTDWALGTATPGFKLLVEQGKFDKTAEYLVIKYKDQFSDKAVQSATAKLEAYGVKLN